MADVIGLRSRVNVILSGAGLETKGMPNGLTFDSILGPTTVTATQDADASAGGQPVVRAAVTTRLEFDARMLNVQQLAVINALASLSAIVKDEKSGGFAVSTRLSCDGEMAKANAVLVAAAAMLHSDSFVAALHLVSEIPGEAPHHAGSDQSILGLDTDFARAEARLRADGILGFSDAGELSAVVPAAGRTASTLALSGTLTHPLLGRGLTYRLTLPRSGSNPKALASLANTLNNWEMQDKLPAGPGAWSISSEGDALCFRGFIPTFCYVPGMALHVVDWLRRKHDSVIAHAKGIMQPPPPPVQGRVRRALAKLIAM